MCWPIGRPSIVSSVWRAKRKRLELWLTCSFLTSWNLVHFSGSRASAGDSADTCQPQIKQRRQLSLAESEYRHLLQMLTLLNCRKVCHDSCHCPKGVHRHPGRARTLVNCRSTSSTTRAYTFDTPRSALMLLMARQSAAALITI